LPLFVSCRFEWLNELEKAGRLEKYIAILPPVNTTRINAAARLHKLMTKDDLERQMSTHELTLKQQQLEALKERHERDGQLDRTEHAEQITNIDCHKVLEFYRILC